MLSCLGFITNSAEVGLIVLSFQKCSEKLNYSPRVTQQLVVGGVGDWAEASLTWKLGLWAEQQPDEDGVNTSTLQVLLGTRGCNTGKGDEEEENDNSSFFFQHFTIYKMFSHTVSLDPYEFGRIGGYYLHFADEKKHGGFSKVIRVSWARTKWLQRAYDFFIWLAPCIFTGNRQVPLYSIWFLKQPQKVGWASLMLPTVWWKKQNPERVRDFPKKWNWD